MREYLEFLACFIIINKMLPIDKPVPRPVGAKDKKMKASLNKTRELKDEMNLRL
jgi:hypothetical protein